MIGGLLFLAVVVTGQNVPVTDPNWYWSLYNWAHIDGQVYTANPGAYFRIGFNGTSVGLSLDQTSSPGTPFMNLWVSVDDSTFKQVSVPQNQQVTVSLYTGLSSNNHQLEVYVYNSLQSEDRWNVPSCSVHVMGLIIDSNAVTISPPVKPATILVYGDSITEGVEANCVSGGDLTSNAATATWAYSLAAGMNAEISVVGFGALGYTRTGNGNVPPLMTPGNDAQSSWNKIDAKVGRSFTPNPDFIVNMHGTNDGLSNAPDDAVTKSVFSWLEAQRGVAPNSTIILSIPFGGFKLNAITNAYQSYVMQYPNDNKTFLVNLGATGARGLTAFNAGTQEACDGIHPFAVRDGQLGSILYGTILATI